MMVAVDNINKDSPIFFFQYLIPTARKESIYPDNQCLLKMLKL